MSNMSLQVQDLFMNSTISTELTTGDVQWIIVCYNNGYEK